MGSVITNRVVGVALSSWNAYRLLTTAPVNAPETTGPWRPPQWSKQAHLTSITLAESQTVTTPSVIPGVTVPSTQTVRLSATYFFDAVLRVDHERRLRITEHPVQNGAAISDHAFMLPARVALEVGMSDAMDRFSSTDYTSNASKSVSAYEKFCELQAKRVPLTLTTRLSTYKNMLIEDIRASDDNRTNHGLRAVISFAQIITADVSSETVSARPQATKSTNLGKTQPLPVPGSLKASHEITKPSKLPGSNIPGAGTFSSDADYWGRMSAITSTSF